MLFLLLTCCTPETGGPADFMTGQLDILTFLVNNWWLTLLLIPVYVLYKYLENDSEL